MSQILNPAAMRRKGSLRVRRRAVSARFSEGTAPAAFSFRYRRRGLSYRTARRMGARKEKRRKSGSAHRRASITAVGMETSNRPTRRKTTATPTMLADRLATISRFGTARSGFRPMSALPNGTETMGAYATVPPFGPQCK